MEKTLLNRPFYEFLLRRSDSNDAAFVFHRSLLRNRLEEITKIASTYNIHILAPVKAFACEEIYPLLTEYLSGFDVSNYGEWSQIRTSLGSRVISFTGPSFHQDIVPSEVGPAMYNVQSRLQAETLISQGITEFGCRIALNTESLASRFGMQFEQIKEIQEHVVGFHSHSGFQNNSVHSYSRVAEQYLSVASKLGIKLRYVNFGGGQNDLSMAQFLELCKVVRKCFPDIEVYFEPGNFLFKNMGYLVAKVIDLDCRNNVISACLNTSRDSHLRWSNPFVVSSAGSTELSTVRFYGASCYEADIIGDFKMDPKELKLNQPIIFGGITGYSVSWNTSFNGLPTAKVAFYD